MSNDRIGIARNRSFRAAARFRRAGEREEGRFRRAQRRRRARTSPASGRSSRGKRCCGTSRSRRSLDESNAPFYKWFEDGELNVSYNCLDRNLANGNADKVAIIFEADDGDGDEGHLPGAAPPRLPPRQRPEVARHQEGRPRAHLHADVDRGRGRDAGLRAHRRDAFGGVRRLFGEIAAGAHHRCRRRGGDHGGRAGARRQARCRSRRSSTRRWAWAGAKASATSIVYRRTGGNVAFDGAARPLDARARREAGGHLRARMGRRRASAVHPVHVGLHRQAEGCAAQLRRLPAVGDADDEAGRSTSSRRISSGAPPTSAGSPATRTSRTDRSPSARPKSCSRAMPTYPDAGRFWQTIAKHKVIDLLHGADGDPRAGQGLRRDAVDALRRITTCRACASSARSASRSIRKPGCGTTRRSAADAARSSTPGGRRRRAAT